MKITTLLACLSLPLASALFFSCDDDGAGGGGTGGTGGTDGGATASLDTMPPGTGGSPASTPNGCDLLTVAEWTPLMGGPPVAEQTTAAWCDWFYRSGGTPTGPKVQRSNLNISIAGAHGASPGSQPIDIGQDGYILITEIARTLDIGWKKGAFSATFKYSALSPPEGKLWPELRDAAIALARVAASRMP